MHADESRPTASAQPPKVGTSCAGYQVARRVLAELEHYDGEPAERLEVDVDRISAMADEVGEAALYATTLDRAALDEQPSALARAYFTFLHHKSEFVRAEEARFADERRRGRSWDAFVAPRSLEVRRDAQSRTAFEAAVSKLFGARQVEAEPCDRHRRRHIEAEASLVQVTIYIEDRPNDLRGFRDGRIAYTTHRPVHEAAIIYEAETGVVEVVARSITHRPELVKLFARHMLALEHTGERIPNRKYRVEHLQRPFEFKRLPEDGLESVVVKSMRLMPLHARGERVALELMSEARCTIWDFAERQLRWSLDQYLLTHVTLAVRFKPRPGEGRGRVLPISTSARTGCNLKDCTRQEQIIGEKYLLLWGILRDV